MTTFIDIPEPCVRVSSISDYDNLSTVQSVENCETMRQYSFNREALVYYPCVGGVSSAV